MSRSAGLDALPLFAAAPASDEAVPSPLSEALGSLDPDAMTPREALDELYRLKRLAEDGE